MENLKLIELDLEEGKSFNGGYPKLPSWVKGSIWGVALGLIVDNWADIKSGFVDGWTDAQN